RVSLKMPDGHGQGQVALRVADTTGDGRPDLLVWSRDLAGPAAGNALVLTPAVVAQQATGSLTSVVVITLTATPATPAAAAHPDDPRAGASDVRVAPRLPAPAAAHADTSAPGQNADKGTSSADGGRAAPPPTQPAPEVTAAANHASANTTAPPPAKDDPAPA